MKIRLHNARILTMEEGREIFWGEIIIEDNRILEVREYTAEILSRIQNGSSENASGAVCCCCSEGFDETIDCEGNLLMPGFKNAHTHSGMSGLRSLADDLPLDEWLYKQIFPVEARMTGEDIYWMSQLSALEYLTSGITACFDMYMEQLDVARAMFDLGFRCVQTSGANNFSSDIYQMSKTYDTLNASASSDEPSLAPYGGGQGEKRYILGSHAEYTTSLENMKKIAEQVRAKKSPYYVHACETTLEVEGCKERYGMTPVQFFDSLGLFEYGGGIFHGVHMSEEDLKVMKDRGLYVVTNPGSNTKLASGIAPIMEYVRRGIPVAIGTDGPASNNCLDFFREMFLVAGLAKIRENDAAALDAREVLRMATVNGARAMHLNDCETISAGQRADIIMLDLMQPNMQPINNIEKNIVYSGSKQNVILTMIDGKILYRNGKFCNGIDAQHIYAKVEEVKRRIMQ